MKNYADGKQLKKIEKRLLKVVQKEWSGRADGMFVAVDKVDIFYCDETPSITLKLRYGKFNNEPTDWHRECELPITDGNLNFIAGQFYQNIVEYENGLLEE